MPRAVDPDKVREYLRLRREGHDNSQASRIAGFSSRTGSNYLKNFRKEARVDGLVKAARSYGLEIEDLFKLAGDLKENELKVGECGVGLYIARVLTRLGVDLEAFDEFVKDVFLEAINQGIPNDELRHILLEFTILRKEQGLTYDQASKSYRELIGNKENLEKERIEIEHQIKSAKERLNEELKIAKITSDEINKFTRTKASLLQVGVPADDYEKLLTLFENLKGLDYDPKSVGDFYSSYNELVNQEKELRNIVESLSSEKRRLSGEKNRLEEAVEEKRTYVDSLRLLEEQSLTPENTRALTEAISALGTKHGLTAQDSIERLTVDLKEHFYPLLSLGEEETRRRNRVHSLNLKSEALNVDLKIQTEVYNSRKKELEALKILNKAGIEDKELITWNSILYNFGMDPTKLKRSIENMGSIEAVVKSTSAELRDLEDKIGQLSKVHSQLESNLKSLTSDTVKEVEKNLGRFNKILDDFEKQFLAEDTGFNAETKRILNDAKKRILKILGTTEASWGDKMEALSKQLENVIKEVEETRDLAYETGKEVGEYTTINMLSKLVRGEPVERNQALAGMHVIASNIERWAMQKRERGLTSACIGLKAELESLMKRV